MLDIIGQAGNYAYFRSLNQRIKDTMHSYSGKLHSISKKEASKKGLASFGDTDLYHIATMNHQLMMVRNDGFAFPITPKDLQRAQYDQKGKSKNKNKERLIYLSPSLVLK